MDHPCDTCADPEHCLGSYPDDDPHKPGRQRGCFRESAVGVATHGIPYTIPGGNRDARWPREVKPPKEPSWEQGIAGEERPGGGFMPYLQDSGATMGVHEHASRRGEIERIRDRQRNDPHVFS